MESENKYSQYLNCECCKYFLSSTHSQVIQNIIEDDESFITEEMKKELFEYLLTHDKSAVSPEEYFNDFFDQPKDAPLSKKKYLLKGELVSAAVYDVSLGRVTSKMGFRIGLNSSILNENSKQGKTLYPISNSQDEHLVEILLRDYSPDTTENIFNDFITTVGIEDYKIQDHPMWTFEAFFSEDAFYGYEIKDLPCILGLPGKNGTDLDYNKIERIAFSVNVPRDISVRKPTSFDAGLMSVWRVGGKTKPHNNCESRYGSVGFSEYVHEPVALKNIASNLYKL